MISSYESSNGFVDAVKCTSIYIYNNIDKSAIKQR